MAVKHRVINVDVAQVEEAFRNFHKLVELDEKQVKQIMERGLAVKKLRDTSYARSLNQLKPKRRKR
jgi:hypothetical protein